MSAYREQFLRDGYLAPVPILSTDEAASYRAAMEAAEARLGTLHYEQNIHTLLKSAYELAAHPKILDAVEQLIGPDIILYGSSFITKEPGGEAYVSWHQDLTYWGLSHTEKVVTGWLAITDATPENGCMQMIPSSHKNGQLEHKHAKDEDNILFFSQAASGHNPEAAKPCALKAGEASFHHGWTVHSSLPNRTKDRRIGFNLQYVAPEVYHVSGKKVPALLVRGEDNFGHYQTEIPAQGEADRVSAQRHKHYAAIMEQFFKSDHA